MALTISVNEETQKIDYDPSTGAVLYQGWAVPGTLTTDAKWKICKMTNNASNQTTDIQWAEGSIGYNFVWDLRATDYTYS